LSLMNQTKEYCCIMKCDSGLLWEMSTVSEEITASMFRVVTFPNTDILIFTFVRTYNCHKQAACDMIANSNIIWIIKLFLYPAICLYIRHKQSIIARGISVERCRFDTALHYTLVSCSQNFEDIIKICFNTIGCTIRGLSPSLVTITVVGT